jgi:RNA polymerase II subunit A C-terminal domain phosphatase
MFGNGAQILSKSYHVSLFIDFLSTTVLTCIVDDFFVGIGDINSTFLPKLEPITVATSPRSAKAMLQQGAANSQKLPFSSQTTLETDNASTTTPLSTTISVPLNEETERAQLAANAMLKENNLALEAQLEERPLAKKQEALQEGDDAAHGLSQSKPAVGAQAMQEEHSPHKHEKRKALLKNDDYELERVAKVRPNQ